MTRDDDQMSDEEMANHFGESVPEKIVEEYPEETLYAIQARLRNAIGMATQSNATGMGIQLCNAYTHVLKDFYVFSHTLNAEESAALIELIQKHESFPANFVAAVHSGLVEAKLANDQIRREVTRLRDQNRLYENNILAIKEKVTALFRKRTLWERLVFLFTGKL